MGRRVTTLLSRIKKNVQLPEMKILPGQLAFFFILTLVPIIALVLVVAGDLNISNEFLESLVVKQFPNTLITIIDYIASSGSVHVNLIIFFVSALVLASNGTYSMIIASNQIYKIKNRGLIYDRIKAVFMLFIVIFLLVFVMVVPVLGNYIIRTISLLIDNATFSNYLYTFYHILNLPLSWLFIFISIKLLYTMAPDRSIPSRNVNYGALFTSFSWVVFTKLYSIYLDLFSNYSSLYGSISGLLVLMWWIYFLSYIYVMGMALNVSKYEYEERNE